MILNSVREMSVFQIFWIITHLPSRIKLCYWFQLYSIHIVYLYYIYIYILKIYLHLVRFITYLLEELGYFQRTCAVPWTAQVKTAVPPLATRAGRGCSTTRGTEPSAVGKAHSNHYSIAEARYLIVDVLHYLYREDNEKYEARKQSMAIHLEITYYNCFL